MSIKPNLELRIKTRYPSNVGRSEITSDKHLQGRKRQKTYLYLTTKINVITHY